MDEIFLKRTFELAKKGLGWTNPNPMVGAVLVKDQKIISSSFHHKFGLPHAEVEAIKNLKQIPSDTTLYVNLEPCSHFGKTPPCADLIIKSGIKKVVCATKDPNPKVSGQGIKKLKQAGVEVKIGVLEKEARQLNEAFFTFHEKKRPYVAIKFAASLDGKIATKTGDPKWITSKKARQFSRKLRGNYQAILVGINTVIIDNPHLGAREKGLKDPLRIIMDPLLKVPINAQVLRDKNVLIVASKQADQKKLNFLKQKSIQVLNFKEPKILVKDLLKKLAELEIISLLVEGGATTLGNFVDEKLVDKVYAFYGPKIIGGENALSAIGGKGTETIKQSLSVKDLKIKRFADNFAVIGYI